MTQTLFATWLLETLVWTGGLMALVLVLRGPVSRTFGPGLAYALWLLPLLRLVVPPVTLPVSAMQASGGAPLVVPVLANDAASTAAPVQASVSTAAGINFVTPLLAVWIAGALAFLLWRGVTYYTMRKRVLEDSVELGRVGKIRVIESAMVPAPVAFGVFDKIVALPVGLSASADRRGCNLALRHELQHHDGGDILLNMAMQPLFALHWFNPVSWLAWRALRRDQEAACDARVLAGEPEAEREAYARLIAGFAAGPRLGRELALACPVAGEKSIIHRLRSLTMSTPSRRRRMAGRTLVAFGALALPLTATVTYAQISAPDAPEPPAPPAAPQAPVAPDAPPAPAAPAAPDAPEPPTPQAPPQAVKNGHRIVMITRNEGGKDGKLYTRTVERNGQRYVLKTDRRMSDAEFDREMAKVDREVAEARRQADEAAAKAAQVEVNSRQIRANAEAEADRALARTEASTCGTSGNSYDFSASSGTGREQRAARIRVCAMGKALDGIRQARAKIAADPKMDDGIRQTILRAMDREIAKLSQES
ncbi:M56 family metallopeptidase [Novosphingobium sp. ZN18A2]|uniref:M56 family metallopeptidase n=1 Tax=Novosphingobium sp. ZN18A2 TaxID=3079861 RepID=UPI0030D1CD46